MTVPSGTRNDRSASVFSPYCSNDPRRNISWLCPASPPSPKANLLTSQPVAIPIQTSPIARISHSNRSRTGSTGCRAIGIICLSAITHQRRPQSYSRLTPRSGPSPMTVVITSLAVVMASAGIQSAGVSSCRHHWPKQKYDCRKDQSSHLNTSRGLCR